MTDFAKTFPDLTPAEISRLIPVEPVMVCYRGSHSHGTYLPPEDLSGVDDVDILTAYVPAIESYFGTEGQTWRGHDAFIGRWDSVSYELRHFAKLLSMANPNVLSTLWLKPEHYIHLGPIGEALIANRDLFSSRLAHKSFGGYAYSQLKRMTAWKDQVSAGCHCKGTFHAEDCALKADKGRGSSKLYATGFMGAKRKALVEKHGYDTKNAAHLLRLLRMGAEFLASGKLNVWREDASFLIKVKRGEYTLEQVSAWAEDEYAFLDEQLKSSPLPEKPNFALIERLITDLLCLHHNAGVSTRARVAQNVIWTPQVKDWRRLVPTTLDKPQFISRATDHNP